VHTAVGKLFSESLQGIVRHCAFCFCTLAARRAGKVVDPDNLLQCVILPAPNVCGVCAKPKKEQGARTDHD